MVVRTQATSEVADKAQRGVMELLLINHPLDCPVCDKGGECPLQNQALSSGHAHSRFTEVKRTFPKPIAISSQVLLDRERCVMCARCTRFSEQIAGDPFIDLFERGAQQQVGVYGESRSSPTSPVTRSRYARSARSPAPPTISGPALRPGLQPGRVSTARAGAGSAPTTVAGRCCAAGGRRSRGQRGVELRQGPLGVHLRTQRDRITTPMVRGEAVGWCPCRGRPHWPPPRGSGRTGRAGVLTGGRLTSRTPMRTPSSPGPSCTPTTYFVPATTAPEEAEFLAERWWVGRPAATPVRRARSPIPVPSPHPSSCWWASTRGGVADHLPAAAPSARDLGLPVFAIAPFASPAVRKTRATLRYRPSPGRAAGPGCARRRRCGPRRAVHAVSPAR